ncbi:MAG: hypothetical protein A2511_14805 [Deltaproteobacteria bacterium RIFOXYD12_FULL_50_9]|nr:MAG: hypothetical protein A2511_14805 [Deltaproteobacteria bacterium RIFOXYD12_FULL_50_9]
MNRLTINPTIFFVAIALSLIISGFKPAWAEMKPILKFQVGVPPIAVLKTILQSNQLTAKNPANKEFPTQTPPLITWLADCDAAIQPQQIMTNPAGKVFTVRNLGFQMEASLDAVDFGVLQLFSPILLITGNTGNQTIRLFMMEADQPVPELRRPFELLKKSLTGVQQITNEESAIFEERLLENIEKNIDFQVGMAVSRYQERIKAGRLLVVGGIIDLHNQYGRGPEKLIITNINGEGNDYCLRQLPIMKQLDPETLTLVIGRDKTGKTEKGNSQCLKKY